MISDGATDGHLVVSQAASRTRRSGVMELQFVVGFRAAVELKQRSRTHNVDGQVRAARPILHSRICDVRAVWQDGVSGSAAPRVPPSPSLFCVASQASWCKQVVTADWPWLSDCLTAHDMARPQSAAARAMECGTLV